jgi:putative ABC transport system permease protein
MNIIKSMLNRKLTTIFFIIAYTLAILSFSIGNSVVEQQKLKVKYINSENNKLLSFKNCDDFNVLDLKQLLENEDITLEVFKTINLNKGESFSLSTNLLNRGLKPFINMKTGSYFTEEDFDSNSNIAIFSSSIDVSNNKYAFKVIQEDVAPKNILLNGKGISSERASKIIVPNKLFLECIEDTKLNYNNLSIKINGEQAAISRAISKIEAKLKEKYSVGKLEVYPYITEDNSEESQYLFRISLMIIIIILLNSINISALWTERRKKEIVLRKVLGATNKDIFNMLFGELTIIALISLILALVGQAILYNFGNANITGINIALYKSNFYYALVLALTTAYVSALPVYIYLLKMQPAQVLLEE